MLSPYPQPSGHGNNEDGSSSEEGVLSSPLAGRLLAEVAEFLKARAAGTEMLQPWFGVGESQLAESDTPENCGVRAADALGIRKFPRKTTL
jgi:hypothetical protein